MDYAEIVKHIEGREREIRKLHALIEDLSEQAKKVGFPVSSHHEQRYLDRLSAIAINVPVLRFLRQRFAAAEAFYYLLEKEHRLKTFTELKPALVLPEYRPSWLFPSVLSPIDYSRIGNEHDFFHTALTGQLVDFKRLVFKSPMTEETCYFGMYGGIHGNDAIVFQIVKGGA